MVRWALVILYVIAGVAVLRTAHHDRAEPFLASLDVGQGDSVVVEAGLPIMIDTGNPGSHALEKAAELGSRIGALVITHLHDDHAGDAIAVLRSRPAAVFWNGVTEGSLYAKINAEAEKQDVPLVALAPGDRLRAGAARFSVLGPSPRYRTSGDPNDASLVMRVDLPRFSALLTGDMTAEAEQSLQKAALDVDVLKVGHHGSKGSTSDVLLDAVTPATALISAGAGNRYGHPSPETLDRLMRRGIAVRRTDQEGNVVVR